MRRIASFAGVVLAGTAVLILTPALAPARLRATVHKCTGTASKPGVLKGTWNGTVVKGYCDVNSGPATVSGGLEVTNGSVLIAAFGSKGSRLTVDGQVVVGQGSTLVLGCNTTSFACVDDPDQSKPTLHSQGKVTGSVSSSSPLGVIIHSTTIGGNVSQSGGGGGLSCAPPKTGPFGAFHSPVYSDYEDNKISGNVAITQLTSCYLGVIRNHVKNLTVSNDKMGDPDAIEIESNVVKQNLRCVNDSQHVWDSSEIPQNGAIYPRALHRNTVDGKREGQCKKAGPLTSGGPPAGGPF
jgi:hypothetical protein